MLLMLLSAVEVVSFNIRYNNPSDGKNAWVHRKDTVEGYLAQSRADFIGLQEVLPSQLADLKPKLSDYNLISRTREAEEGKGESAPLLYRQDRWRVDAAAAEQGCGEEESRRHPGGAG